MIEETVKALTEFESELDKIKSETVEARKKMVRDATEWAESSKSSAMARAQETATARLAKAREEAEAEAESLKKKGKASLKDFESNLSKHTGEAAELVAARLRGGSA